MDYFSILFHKKFDYVVPLDGKYYEALFSASSGSEWSETTITGTTPIYFKSNGDPLTDYLISGNAVQNGTPTPEAPVDVVGCGVRTEQLWRNLSNYRGAGVTIRSEINGLYFSGTCTSSANVVINAPLAAGSYTLKANANRMPVVDNNACVQIYWNTSDIPTVLNRNAITGSVYFTVRSDIESVEYRIRLQSGVNYDGFILRPTLNIGDAKPFEPYGYKIPLTIGGTEYPIYLGQVETTRRIKKWVLTGEENWVYRSGEPSSVFFVEFKGAHFINNSALCTHYLNQDSGSFNEMADKHVIIRFANDGTKSYIGLRDSSIAQTDGVLKLKAYLAKQYQNGTPVTVWYVLATPETAVVNEPLMKIGDYVDAISFVQASATIPTVAGANTLAVGTTVQPSSMSITGRIREAADV